MSKLQLLKFCMEDIYFLVQIVEYFLNPFPSLILSADSCLFCVFGFVSVCVQRS